MKRILTVKQFMGLVVSKSPLLKETFILTHKVEPGRVYERCQCTADTVTDLRTLTRHGNALTWSDDNGDPLINITGEDMLLDKATYDGEWLTTVYQLI